MAYSLDLENSARRHLRSAEVLHACVEAGSQPGGSAVAGYLFGLAGELAVKQMMRESGIRPLEQEARGEDPFYAHFPKLKRLLLPLLNGRRAGQLRKVAESDRIFREWDTDMRYAPTAEVRAALVSQWREDANQLVAQMGAN